MALELTTAATPHGASLVARGEIDLDNSPQLLAAIQAALSSAAAGSQLAVRLTDVAYIDSSGVATLIQGLKQAGRRQVQLVLEAPSARVLDVLELAQLRSLFKIRTSDQDDGCSP